MQHQGGHDAAADAGHQVLVLDRPGSGSQVLQEPGAHRGGGRTRGRPVATRGRGG